MTTRLLVTVDSLRKDHMEFMPKTQAYLDEEYDTAYATYPSTIGSFQSILGGVYPTSPGLDAGQSFFNHIEDTTNIGVTTNILTSEKYDYDQGIDSFEHLGENSIHGEVGRILPEGILLTILSKGWNIFTNIAYRFKDPDREYGRGSEVIENGQTKAEDAEDIFIWLHLMDVHHPYHAETKSEMSRKDAYNLTKRIIGQNGGSDEEEAQTRALYQDTVKQLDDELDALWEWAGEDAEVIFCADHGEHLGEKNHWGHHEYLDDILLNVPFGTKNITVPDTNVISLIDIPSLFLQEDYNHGQYGDRDYAYALCDDKRAITDGETMVTTDDDRDDAPRSLFNKLDRFDPGETFSQQDALDEDLEALGYK